MGTLRILIVDDNPDYLASLRNWLVFQPEWRVVGCADCGAAALTLAQQLRPDLIILDANLPDMTTLNIVSLLRAQVAHLKIVVLMLDGNRHYLATALAAGADEALDKAEVASWLQPVVRRLFAFAPERG